MNDVLTEIMDELDMAKAGLLYFCNLVQVGHAQGGGREFERQIAGRFAHLQEVVAREQVNRSPTTENSIDWEAHARFLWDLLDNIDSLDDMAKDEDAVFRHQARIQQRRRFEISDSDGHTVTFRGRI